LRLGALAVPFAAPVRLSHWQARISALGQLA